jgi:putative ABC transport system permease protein
LTRGALLLRLLSWRQIVAAPGRSFLTFAAIALGVGMIVGVAAAHQAVLEAFSELTERTAGRADLEIRSDEAGVPFELVEKLQGARGIVAHAAARLEQQSFVAGGSTPGERVLVLGLDFLGDREFFPYKVSRGADLIDDPLAFLNDPRAVMVSESLAARRGIKLGTTLSLRTAHGMEPFHVVSLLEETTSARVFGGQVVVMFLDAAQLAFARGHQVDGIDVRLRDREQVDAAIARLQQLIGDTGTVARPSKRSAQLARMTGSFQAAGRVQGLLALVVGMFLVYNAVGVAVSQRKREVGVLRSLGAHQRTIACVFLVEAATLALLGAGAGIALGRTIAERVLRLLTPSVSRLYQSIAPGTPEVTWQLALQATIAALLATLAAAWLPSRRAALTEPVEAMRSNVHAGARAGLPPKQLLVLGVGFYVVGAILSRMSAAPAAYTGVVLMPLAAALCTPFVLIAATDGVRRLFGDLTPGMLGLENCRRDVGRSGITAAVIVVTTAASLTHTAYIYSFEQTTKRWSETVVPGDIVVTAGSPLADHDAMPLSPDWEPRIAAVRDVEATMVIRSLSVSVEDYRVEVVGLPSEIYLARLRGRRGDRFVAGQAPLERSALAREPAVLVSENFASRFQLGAGDHVTLPSPTGRHRFRVAAVMIDYHSDQGSMIMDRRYLQEYWQDDRVDAVEIFTRPGADADALVARIRAQVQGDDEGVFILKSSEITAEIQGMIAQTLSIARASEVISLVIALLGIIGTMFAAVLDRAREFGVLSAIGASRAQIVWAVASEAGWLSTCGACIAVLASVPLTLLFLDVVGPRLTGWNIPLSVPLQGSLRVLFVMVATGTLAGIVPGLRAARVDVKRPLLHE